MVFHVLNNHNKLYQVTSIFAFISLRSKFLLELSVDYRFSSKKKFFFKSQITHFLLIKVVDDPPLVPMSYFTMFIIISMFREKMVAFMEEIIVLKHM